MTAQPRHHTPRSDRPTRGGQAAAIARAKGKPWMPWQQDAADVALEVDPATGLPWYGIVVISVPRQSGKTKLEGDLGDHRCLTTPRARVWLTMQTGKDASAWMRDEHFASLEVGPWGKPGRPGSARWKDDRRAGAEGVVWHPPLGSTFRAFAPKRDALHSKQSDAVFVDEAWAHDAATGADLRQAIRPTMATRPGAQLYIVSTRGDDTSEYLNAYLDLALANLNNPASRIALIDYGIGADVDPEDLDAIAAAHPAFGHTINMQTLVDAREDFRADPRGDDVAGWARAYGNRSTAVRVAAFPPGVWQAAGRPQPDRPTRVGLGFDVTPAGDHVAVAVAWRDRDELWLEVLPSPTIADAPGYIAALATKYRVPATHDTAGVATLDLADRIAREHKRVRLDGLTTERYVVACARVLREANAGTLRHSRQPALDGAVDVAALRPVRDGGQAWTRKGSTGSIAELVAGTVAVAGYDALPPARTNRVLAAAR